MVTLQILATDSKIEPPFKIPLLLGEEKSFYHLGICRNLAIHEYEQTVNRCCLALYCFVLFLFFNPKPTSNP